MYLGVLYSARCRERTILLNYTNSSLVDKSYIYEWL